MPALTKQREKLIGIINNLSDNEIMGLMNYFFPDMNDFSIDNEPPLNEDELKGLEIAKKELSDGKGIPFAEVIKDLW